ncbi:MAG TPA: HK97 family phage prohead protease [Planctomycetota bacterium]|nr:HK97 family phage prohead protease [Planctomycetota bacterium]
MTTTLEAPPLKPADAAGCLPRKTFDVEFQSLDDSGSFEMYAATFGGAPDRQGDVIAVGAFDNLPAFTTDGFLALNHDMMSLPVAIIESATQDSHGLRVSGRFHSTPEAQAVRTVCRERMALKKRVLVSIGYVCNAEEYERVGSKQVRHIKALSLFEVSVVGIPANPRAEMTGVKSLHPQDSTMSETKTDPPVETKRSVAISAANMKMLDAYGDQAEEHHKAIGEACKGLKACHKAMCDTHAEMKSFLQGFKPDSSRDSGQQQGDEAEEGADEEGGESEATEKPKPKKSAPVLTEAQKTAQVLRDQLRRRSLEGRKTQACP